VQDVIRRVLRNLARTLFKDRDAFERVLDAAARNAVLKLSTPARKAVLSERDEPAAICRDRHGNPEPDPELRDTESVPLAEGIDAFFAREVARARRLPGSIRHGATRGTARSASSATRSTSTAISIATRGPARLRRSRPTSVRSKPISSACWPR
jgi:hypothetical protein